MRAFTFLASLGLFASAFAAPVSEPGALNKFPVLFAKDPLSIHKRAANRNPEPRVAAADVAANPELDEVTEVATQDEDSCAEVCGIRKVEGAKTEREALCSIDGLRATLECAQCIDSTWPDTTYEDSAVAEYERIVEACKDAQQVAFHRGGF